MSTSEFSRDEYLRRVDAIQGIMRAREYDALLISDARNHRYFTGHYSEMALQNRALPSATWIPPEGPPVIVTHAAEAPWAEEVSIADRVYGYGDLHAVSGILGYETALGRALVQAGRDLQLTSASRIATPMDSWHRVDLTLGVIDEIRTAFADAEWCDGSEAVWACRMIKSAAEIEVMREAVAALDAGFAALPALLAEADTERAAIRAFRRELLNGGADHLGYTIISDVAGSTVLTTPSDRPIPDRAVMFVDGGAFVRGYTADYNKLVSMGEPTSAERDAYGLMCSALEAARLAARVGNTAGDIARAMHEVLLAGGLDSRFLGRSGHGTGMEVPEPPSLHPADETPLQAGMVLSLEPNGGFEDVGFLIVEDMVVVGEDEPTFMSSDPTPPELITVP
jgi:Xaa-Pro dipeptidase